MAAIGRIELTAKGYVVDVKAGDIRMLMKNRHLLRESYPQLTLVPGNDIPALVADDDVSKLKLLKALARRLRERRGA